jgi:Domain of unknown function (DUF1707)
MIPVMALPAFPGFGLDPLSGADPRASDADRDVAADILCAAVADGRLTLAELDERLGDVLSARTLRELARLISDLGGSRFPGPVRGAVRQAARRKPAASAARPRPPAETRWSLLQSLVRPATD